MIIILMLHEQKEEQQKEKADSKKEFRQIVKKALQPVSEELDDLVKIANLLAEGTSALVKNVEYTLDEECKRKN